MTSADLWINLTIGIFTGIVASILTLIGDRWRHRTRIRRRLRHIVGDYTVETIAPRRDTRAEEVAIRQVEGRRFSITASKGPTGDWIGDFIVREDFFDVAHGVYRYPNSTDWGQHELVFDSARKSIFVYGVNRSKPGLIEPFSYKLVRRIAPERELGGLDDG